MRGMISAIEPKPARVRVELTDVRANPDAFSEGTAHSLPRKQSQTRERKPDAVYGVEPWDRRSGPLPEVAASSLPAGRRISGRNQAKSPGALPTPRGSRGSRRSFLQHPTSIGARASVGRRSNFTLTARKRELPGERRTGGFNVLYP